MLYSIAVRTSVIEYKDAAGQVSGGSGISADICTEVYLYMDNTNSNEFMNSIKMEDGMKPADPAAGRDYFSPADEFGYSNPTNPGGYSNPSAGNNGFGSPGSGRGYSNPGGNARYAGAGGFGNPGNPGRNPNPYGSAGGYGNPGTPGGFSNPSGGAGGYGSPGGGRSFSNPGGNAGYPGSGGGGGNYPPGSGMGYMDPPPRTPAIVQAEIKRTRHNKEIPLYIAMIILGVIASLIMLIQSASGNGLLHDLLDLISDIGTGAGGYGITYVASFFLLLSGLVFGVFSIAFLFATYLIGVYQLYARQMSYSVRVSETNFPEIYAKVREYSWLLGWKKEPEVYVQQMNGEINAFTSWVPGKVFIQLNAEIVDLAYMENRDFDTIYFIMAHEFGHAYLHHVQLYYAIWPTLVTFIPVIGPMILSNILSRAREYSADRVSQALTGGVRQEETMMLLSVGRHTYKYMNVHDYLRSITANHNAVERFARWCTNLTASHPIFPYRVSAILDPAKKSGRLF